MHYRCLQPRTAALLTAHGDEQTDPDRDLMRYLERFVEFLTDLLAQLPTRRFFLAVYNNSLTQVKLELELKLVLELVSNYLI